MKEFNGARVQFTSIDSETEEKNRMTLSDIVEDADVSIIQAIGSALDGIVDGEMTETKLTQTFDIV